MPEAQEVAPESSEEAVPGEVAEVIKFTDEERNALNIVTSLIVLARKNMESVWNPIRARYHLPEEITYDRTTGVVAPKEAQDV